MRCIEFTEMKSVIVADDSPILLYALSNHISEMDIFESVSAVNNGLELLEEFGKTPTDLLIIDIAMPQMSGFDVVKKIRLLNKDVKILFISNFISDEIVIKSLLLGANGFIRKIKLDVDLNKAIESIKLNNLYFSEEIIGLAKNNCSDYLTGLECYEVKNTLSKREYEVFREIGATSNCKEVSTKLEISKKTVDNHLETSRRKLRLKSKNELYRIAHFHYQTYCKTWVNNTNNR